MYHMYIFLYTYIHTCINLYIYIYIHIYIYIEKYKSIGFWQYQSNIERRQLVFDTLKHFTVIESASDIRKLTSRHLPTLTLLSQV